MTRAAGALMPPEWSDMSQIIDLLDYFREENVFKKYLYKTNNKQTRLILIKEKTDNENKQK